MRRSPRRPLPRRHHHRHRQLVVTTRAVTLARPRQTQRWSRLSTKRLQPPADRNPPRTLHAPTSRLPAGSRPLRTTRHLTPRLSPFPRPVSARSAAPRRPREPQPTPASSRPRFHVRRLGPPRVARATSGPPRLFRSPQQPPSTSPTRPAPARALHKSQTTTRQHHPRHRPRLLPPLRPFQRMSCPPCLLPPLRLFQRMSCPHGTFVHRGPRSLLCLRHPLRLLCLHRPRLTPLR